MDRPYWTPPSSHAPRPPLSSVAPTLPYQRAVPAQVVQHQPQNPHSLHHNYASLPPRSSSSITSAPTYPSPVPAQSIQHKKQQRRQQDPTRQSPANTHTTLIQDGIQSTEQRTAVAILQGIPIPDILDCLEGFRSLLRGERGFYPALFTPQQRQAVSTLIGCSNRLVEKWLNDARSPGTLISSEHLGGNSQLSDGWVATHSLAQAPYDSSEALMNVTPRNAWDQKSYILSGDPSVRVQKSSAAVSNDHARWCFICEDHRLFTTRDGFKRHMQEHYTKFHCPECIGKSYTRKENLIPHLKKKHGVNHTSTLVNQSKHTTDQKYFACGFCIFWCDSPIEQVNHIDAHHYKFSYHIRDWNDDKVIRGLLRQPGVGEHWRRFLTINPHLQESWFSWKAVDAKQVRDRLEMSRDPTDMLCQATIDISNYGTSQHGQFEPIHPMGLTDEGIHSSQPVQTLQPENASSMLPYTSGQCVPSHIPWVAAPTLPSQPLASDSNRLEMAPETYGLPASAMHYNVDRRAPSVDSPIRGENFMQHQHPAYPSPTASASHISQASEGQLRSSRLGGFSLGMSPYVATNPWSRQPTETPRHPVQSHADSIHPTLTTQTASSHLSRHRDTSPLDHFNSAYSPTLATQSSCLETIDRQGMDMDFDSNNQQPFIHYYDRSQGPRRGS